MAMKLVAFAALAFAYTADALHLRSGSTDSPPNVPASLNFGTGGILRNRNTGGADAFKAYTTKASVIANIPWYGPETTGQDMNHATYRITGSQFKIYLDAVNLVAGTTYSIYYTINGGATQTLGTGYTDQSSPFIYRDVVDGTYAIEAWIVSSTNVASTENWKMTVMVDNATPTVSITTTIPAYTSSTTGVIKFSSSKSAVSLIGAKLYFYCTFNGATSLCDTITANGAVEGTYTYNIAAVADGVQTFSVYVKEACDAVTDNTVAGGYCDATWVTGKTSPTTSTLGAPVLTWTKDTVAPTVVVTKTPITGNPVAPSTTTLSYSGTGGVASFEFSCNDATSLPGCTYMCTLNGFATLDATATSTASKGWTSCSSPVTITMAPTSTAAFQVYALDAASNTSPESSVYTFYNDNTKPTTQFLNEDWSQLTSNGLSPLKYDAAANVMTTAANRPLSTANTNAYKGYYPTQAGRYETINGAQLAHVAGSNSEYGTITAGNADQYLTDGTTKMYYYPGYGANTYYNIIDDDGEYDGTPSWEDQLHTGGDTDATNNIRMGVTATTQPATVLQIPLDESKSVWDLATGYSGAILAARTVQASYGTQMYFNVLLRTNSQTGTLGFQCTHPEFLNG